MPNMICEVSAECPVVCDHSEVHDCNDDCNVPCEGCFESGSICVKVDDE